MGEFGQLKRSIYRLVSHGNFFKVEMLQDVEFLRNVFLYVIILDVIYDHDGVLSRLSVEAVNKIHTNMIF